jgi:flavin-dependent dehydrogenase
VEDIFDVVVVGAGPGGSVAAKRCVESGLKTLLLEKHKLPRDKVCSGMIMSRLAQTLVEKEFGKIPQMVLATPTHLSGLSLHVLGEGKIKVEHKMPIAWRKDLDYWMNQHAHKAGVEIRDNITILGINETVDGYLITLKEKQEEEEVRTRFVIGADGATSGVRKACFPSIKIQYVQVIQECYQGKLDLEREYFHFFYFPETPIAPSFDAHHKEDSFIIDVMARVGELKKFNLVHKAKEILTKKYYFDLQQKPLWRKGCVQPLMNKELFTGSFTPYKGNILLVGEAAGLMPFIAGDGIGEAIWSGMLAATSIIKAKEVNEKAEKFYKNGWADIILLRKKEYPWVVKIKELANKGGPNLLEALEELWGETLNLGLEHLPPHSQMLLST